jgi:hypothetical protein
MLHLGSNYHKMNIIVSKLALQWAIKKSELMDIPIGISQGSLEVRVNNISSAAFKKLNIVNHGREVDGHNCIITWHL